MDPVIRFDRVTKLYGRQVALVNVTFEVPPGVVFALLGENGAGKTTAIKILLGLAESDAGQTRVLGFDSRRQGLRVRQCVGYVPERLTLYEWMTVEEIGWFTAGFFGDGFLPRYRRLTGEFQLPWQRRLKTLSKGMRAKVALSLAMAHDPELLVLDEPTSGLDPLVRREFLESMVDRAATGKTVFLASHQIHEVERVADMVGILRGGQLCLVERLETLKRQFREITMTLAGYEDSPPPVGGEVLRACRRARQWQGLVRNVADDEVARLREHTAVTALDARTPSLEEILVGYLRAESPRADLSREQVADRQEVRP